MKKLFINFTFILGLLFCLTSVNALSYTEYKIGDEIKVNVNNTEKISFFVIKESSKNEDSLTAITYDVIDEKTYTYEESESLLASTKTIWNNASSVSFPTMQILFGNNVNLTKSFEFNDPSFVKSNSAYWTSTQGEEGWAWTVGNDISKNGQAGVFEKTQKMYVRPVIEISKEYVVGGVVRTAWEDFIEYFKKSELLESMSYDDISIEGNENKLNISTEINKNTYNTEYTFENGVVVYSKKGDKFVDHNLNTIVIQYLIDKFNYNYHKFYKYIYDTEKLTLSNNGIEYTISELYTEEEMKQLSKEWEESQTKEEKDMGFANELTFTDLKVDIINGVKSYDESLIQYYDFVEGENQKYIVGTTAELKFKIDAESSLFDSVYVNGKEVENNNYMIEEGSTIITLKKSYLDTLNSGIHTLKVTYKDGEFAQTQFTIETKNPNTGINIQYELLIIVILICLSTYLIIRKKTKFPKHN